MFLLGCSLSGLANTGTGEDPFIQSITSPESHMYKRGGFLSHGLLVKNFCEDFSVTSRRWVETLRRFNVATFQRRDVNFTLLWNVVTWIRTSRR